VIQRPIIVVNYRFAILSMTDLEHNIAQLNLRIHQACSAASRKPDDITLLAVSKTRDTQTIRQAYHSGLLRFGENYASEAAEKIPFLPDDIEWHFIGPVQSNKTAFIASHFTWVQTVDRMRIARRLNDQRPAHLPPLHCLIQVNISDDPDKSGVTPEEVEPLAKEILLLPRITLRGLMTIPKAGLSPDQLAADFARMAQLLRQLQAIAPLADTLSMGMSDDLEIAIANGTTMVRVGTDLFGPRAAKQ
jgi:pyridoxal phosphate enzyme (YggS family)